MNYYKLYNNTKLVFETPDDGYSYFFGYYDKPSLNIDNTKLLTHRVSFDGQDVQDGDYAEIGYFDLLNENFSKVDETLAWNWQQGSQLQWLPPDYNKKIIYNSIKDNKFVSIIYDIETKSKKIIPFPIYAIHPNGNEALGVNYERLYWCRPGYNYKNIKNSKWNRPYDKDDGIYKINLNNGKVDLIISIEKIININHLDEFEKCNNWLEHLMYSPSGKKFMFLHRWKMNNEDNTRLYVADSFSGQNIISFPDSKFYSHYFWKKDDILTIWSKEYKNPVLLNESILQRFKKKYIIQHYFKPIYKFALCYFCFLIGRFGKAKGKLYDFNLSSNKVDTADNNILNKYALYGHQSWFKDKKTLLIDSYQNSKNYRHVYIFDTMEKSLKKIAKFFSLYNDSVYRCDLHPRLSIDNKFITVDTVYSKTRKQVILEYRSDKKNI